MAHPQVGIWWEMRQPGSDLGQPRSVVAGQREVHTEGLQLQTGPRDRGQQRAQLVGGRAVATHAAGQLHDHAAVPPCQRMHVIDAAHGEHRSAVARSGERGREHHRCRGRGHVVHFVHGADAHHARPGRGVACARVASARVAGGRVASEEVAGEEVVQQRAPEPVPVALHHRHQPIAVRRGRAAQVRHPRGAVDGEADGHTPPR